MIGTLMRGLLVIVLGLLVWPEFARYRAEWSLREVNVRLDRALQGVDRGQAALQSVGAAALLAKDATKRLPADPRPPLLEGIALILLGKGSAAQSLLDAAVQEGERPELTLNQGRARALLGDEAGALSALLRTAWASPLAIESLPASMRADLRQQVVQLEAQLGAGTLKAPPGG